MEILNEVMKDVHHVNMYAQRTLYLVFGMEHDLIEQVELMLSLI